MSESLRDRSRRTAAAARLTYPYGRYTETEYLQSLTGKRVIIVGPAGYLQGRGLGPVIDGYDVVVRVNHAIPVAFPEDYGSRTDVLYHILSHIAPEGEHKLLVTREEVVEWAAAGVKWLVSRHEATSRRVSLVGPLIDGLLPWACMRASFYERVNGQIGRKSPNTGVAAIAHLLTSEAASVSVVGFDLYASGVYHGYGDIKPGDDPADVNSKWHDAEAQVAYLQRIFDRDIRLCIDDRLAAILNRPAGGRC